MRQIALEMYLCIKFEKWLKMSFDKMCFEFC